MFKIILTKRALKDLEAVDKEAQRKIATKLKEYASEPLKHARKLSNPKMGIYRLRIGEYRVIFDIDADNMVILRIGHRKNIYR